MQYDLLVVGSGPGGQKAAIAAAKLGKRVGIIERSRALVGGVCLHTGTIPSKTIREAILHLTGFRQRDVYSDRFRQKRQITMDDLRRKLAQVGHNEWQVIQDQFERNDIDVHTGTARFLGPHEIEVASADDNYRVQGNFVVLAPGTKPARPAHIPFDACTVFDADELLQLNRVPRSMTVIGAGVIGIEYGLMLAVLGVRVTIIDGRERLLDFCDREIIDALVYHARSLGIAFRLGENVAAVQRVRPDLVSVELESGKRILGETALFSVGRVGDTDEMNLMAAGLEADDRGRLSCNDSFQTDVPHIYGVGDVVGFPALASASMEQGRKAVCHAFHQPYSLCPHLPYGLFTIPEISVVGKNEQQLTAERAPYEVGIAHFSEIARGQIAGDTTGMLKLLFHRQTKELLGVHVIGEAATEIVHIGQTVMALGGTIDYFRDTVFNYPTMAEGYKVAALDGLNKLRMHHETMPPTSAMPRLTPSPPVPTLVPAG